MEEQFRDINYLKQGNFTQKLVYELLIELKIFEVLKSFNPILVGTIPIDIHIFSSDLDIICEVYDHDDFEKAIIRYYGDHHTFHIEKCSIGEVKTSIFNFKYKDMDIEIFGQPKPVFQQNGYRHMIIEKRILDLSGEELKEEIRRLKKSGIKTEPAFAKHLELAGDPFEELLKLAPLSDEELARVIKGQGDRFLCVMAGYDDHTEKLLSNIQRELYKKGYDGDHTKDLPQHITLGTFRVSQEMEIRELLKKVAARTEEFTVTLNHVGIFAGSKVLFIAPDLNQKLLELKENFGDSYNWTPHTTMLIDKPNTIYQALPIVADKFEAFEGRINHIYLYEFWPTRFICSEGLIKENIL